MTSPLRRAMAGVATLFFVNGLALGSWLPRLPEIRDRLGVDLAAIGLALALGGSGGLIGSALSGSVVARLGTRRAACVPAALLMGLLPLVAVVPTAVTLGIVVGVAGLADAIADVGMNAVGVRLEEGAGRSIMNRLHGLWSLGSLSGAAISAGAVMAGTSLTTQLVATSVVGLASVGLALRLLPDPPLRARPVRRPWTAISFAVAGGAAALIEGIPADWSALFLTDVMGMGPGGASLGFVVFMAGMVSGRMAGDSVVDRFGSARTLGAGMMLVVLGAALVIATPSQIGSVGGVFVGFGLWGLGASVTLPMLYKLAGAHPSFAEGAGLGALTVGSRLGFVSGAAGVGAIAARTGLPIGILVMLSIAAVGALFGVRAMLADLPSPVGAR